MIRVITGAIFSISEDHWAKLISYKTDIKLGIYYLGTQK